MKDGIKIQGIFTIKHIRNGKVLLEEEIKNTITDAGKAQVAALVGNISSPTAFSCLGVGTGTNPSAVTDTTLQSEIVDSGLARASATMSRVTTTVTNDTLQMVKSWTASGSKAVTEVGAFNAVSSGIMLGRQVFSAVNLVPTDIFEVTYKFIFS